MGRSRVGRVGSINHAALYWFEWADGKGRMNRHIVTRLQLRVGVEGRMVGARRTSALSPIHEDYYLGMAVSKSQN